MRKLILTFLCCFLATPLLAQASDSFVDANASTTRGQWTLSRMFKPGGYVGWPEYASDPATCSSVLEGAQYYNTTANEPKYCDGSTNPWSSAAGGGLSSPIAGDFVATGKWTWGTAADAANSVRFGETAGCLVFEGSGADAFESSLCVTNPTVGDQTFNLPNLAGASTDTIATLSADQKFSGGNTFGGNTYLGGAGAGVADSLTIRTGTGELEFEGATQDTIETMLSAADPTNADQLYQLPDAAQSWNDVIATLALAQAFSGRKTFGSAADAANAVDLNETAGQITFEGATGGADANETRLAVTDPTGDRVITFPDASGTVLLSGVGYDWTANQEFQDDIELVFGDDANASILYETALTPDSLAIEASADSNTLHLYEAADENYDFQNGPNGTSAATDPTLLIHSHNQSTSEWASIEHNGSDAIAKAGAGQWSFPGNVSGATTDEIIGAGAAPNLASGAADNVVLGAGAAPTLSTGDYNVCVGSGACPSNSTGGKNIAVGYGAGPGGNWTETIVLGYNAEATGHNQLVIGSYSSEIYNAYFNSVLSASPDDIAINASGGSGTNIAGADFTFAGGKGTGNANGGNIIFQASREGASGTTLQTLEERARVVAGTQSLTDEVKTNVLAITVPADTGCGATIEYYASAQDGSTIAMLGGKVNILAYEEPGAAAYACDVDEETNNSLVNGGTTLGDTWTCTAGATTYLEATFNSEPNDLATTLLYNVTMNSGCAITPQ